MYLEGKAVGSLCTHVCSDEDTTSLSCHNFGISKETVFSIEWHNTRIMFKPVSSNVRILHWFDNGVLKYPTEREFSAIIRTLVKNHLNISLDNQMTKRLTHLRPSYEEKNMIKRQVEMDNLWLLLQDNEFLLSVIYNEKEVFPEVFGTCGSYFAVEYIQPIRRHTMFLGLSESREDWAERLRLSLQIIDLLDELEINFKDPLHLCDIKVEHFGYVKENNKLKFVDLDGVYPKSVINRIISDTPSCESDDDCDFYDCRSRCVHEIKKCIGFVTNNNLQMVCEKLFLGWRLSNTVMVPGLLMSQHTPSELASVLRQCANPSGEPGKPRSETDNEIKKRLMTILSEVEQIVNDDVIL